MSARHWSDGWTRDNLIDEIERLKAALQDATNALEEYCCTSTDHPCGCYDQMVTARRALEGEMSEVDDAIDQIESHAALYREQRLRAEIERLRAALNLVRVYWKNVDRAEREEPIYREVCRALEDR